MPQEITAPEGALDIANWTGDPPQSWYDRLRAEAGIGSIIPQAINPPPGYPPGVTVPQGQKTLDAGLALYFYLWLWLGIADPIGDIRRKLDLIARFSGQVMRLGLDVEDNTVPAPDQGGDAERYLDLVEQALEVMAEYPVKLGLPMIYSGPWYWLRWLLNSWRFKDRYHAWPADYNENPAVDAFEWYGGWATGLMHQHIGTSTVLGVGNVDQNGVAQVEVDAQLGGEPVEPAQPDLNPLLVPFAHMADVLVADRLNAELTRRTRSGALAAPRRSVLATTVADVASLREQVLGPRPVAGRMLAQPTTRAQIAQARSLNDAIVQFQVRAARRAPYRPAA